MQSTHVALTSWAAIFLAIQPLRAQETGDGDGAITLSGEWKQWHKVTLTLDGPYARESDQRPNPFTDCLMEVRFWHVSGSPSYLVPGYFAADGEAADSSATEGRKWRAHFTPDLPGSWQFEVAFRRGDGAALSEAASGQPVAPYHGRRGSLQVGVTDKMGRDFRGQGRLCYVGQRYLRFQGSGTYFLKVGADAPENLLAYADFDGTSAPNKPGREGEAAPPGKLKTWGPHERDWRQGDPTWKGGKGQGLIGALNYLAEAGANGFSFLTYNAGGDGDDVWPFAARETKLHYDCSKLDQWGRVFDHATKLGLFLHFKLQEQEMDDLRLPGKPFPAEVPTSLDGGELGPERRLYCRELVARFGHGLALNWNLGEENSQSPEQQRAMAKYLAGLDPYKHPIVVHTFPDQQEKVYPSLLGDQSPLAGASLQNAWHLAHEKTLHWLLAAERAGKPWVICQDEQNPPGLGTPPDPGVEGFDGRARSDPEDSGYTLHDIRKRTLWGTLMAGGAGVEYYFGYSLPQNDLRCEDWRSRAGSWHYGRVALDLFTREGIPFWEMTNADALVGQGSLCLAQPGKVYLVYLPQGGSTELDLTAATGTYSLRWYDPREGGPLARGSATSLAGGAKRTLGLPPKDIGEDWLAVLRAETPSWVESVTLPPSETAQHLFNGDNLEGWEGQKDRYWSVRGGVIRGANEGVVEASTYLFTAKAYRDFRLLFEVKQTMGERYSTMHSAVGVLGERIEDKGDPFGFKGPLVMFCHDWGIWDAHGRNRVFPPTQNGPMSHPAERIGEWNQIELLVVGDRLRKVVNGQMVMDFTDRPGLLKASPIGLQLHANARPQEYHFRGLLLSEGPEDRLLTLKP